MRGRRALFRANFSVIPNAANFTSSCYLPSAACGLYLRSDSADIGAAA